ncbi:hypothetical protein OIU76_012474 [Salix suchowensis]|nr:hypothetical protein OIU76_012474 [Salix suchowensis]
MVGAAKESNPEAVQENTGLVGFEEVEEAFTFCNLSLNNCDVAHWDNFSRQDQSLSPFDHQNHFGFFSDASAAHSSDSIIFCGKLIPFKGEKPVAETAQNQEITYKSELTRKSSISPSKLSHSSSKSTETAAARSNASPEKQKTRKGAIARIVKVLTKGHAGRKLSAETYDSSMRKGSNLPPLMKSRSHPVRSGAGKFSMEMGLSDTKMMQSKRDFTTSDVFT